MFALIAIVLYGIYNYIRGIILEDRFWGPKQTQKLLYENFERDLFVKFVKQL